MTTGVQNPSPPTMIVPPFTRETAVLKVRQAEDAWNSRDPAVSPWPTPRTRSGGTGASSSTGRDQIREFLAGKWERELDYRLVKALWAFTDDRIAVRFQYEWHDAAGQWHRSYGNELWEFDERGLMRRREASINDVPSSKPTASSSGPLPAPTGGPPRHPRRPVTSRTFNTLRLGDTIMTRTTRIDRWLLSLFAATAWTLGPTSRSSAQQPVKVLHKTVKVGDLDIFYREAGSEGRPDGPPAPRLPDQLADVPQPDPRAGGQVPRRRARLPRLRPQLDAVARQVHLHLRQPGEGDRRVHREARADEIRPLRAGLRRPGRLPPGRQAPGADHRHRRAERQRLRRGAGQRLLEADQGVLEGAEQQGKARRPSRGSSPTKRPSGSTRTA